MRPLEGEDALSTLGTHALANTSAIFQVPLCLLPWSSLVTGRPLPPTTGAETRWYLSFL